MKRRLWTMVGAIATAVVALGVLAPAGRRGRPALLRAALGIAAGADRSGARLSRPAGGRPNGPAQLLRSPRLRLRRGGGRRRGPVRPAGDADRRRRARSRCAAARFSRSRSTRRPTTSMAARPSAPRDPSRARGGARFRTFRQVASGGSFEGYTTVGLGVRARLPFRMFVLRGPGSGSRLVIDVAHRW